MDKVKISANKNNKVKGASKSGNDKVSNIKSQTDSPKIKKC